MQRRTPLRRSNTLRRSGGSNAKRTAASSGQAASRSKAPVMTPQERACRKTVAARSGGFCEACGEPGGLEKAHRVARSQGGEWMAANILDLCRRCHSGNHANPARAYEYGWHLRGGSDPTAEPVLLWKGSRRAWAVLADDGGLAWTAPPAASVAPAS